MIEAVASAAPIDRHTGRAWGDRLIALTFGDTATALLFLAMALAACLMPAQSDTWWLLRAGEDTWTLAHPVLRDAYTHTVNGWPWPNHEWLSQALFYGLYRFGGMPLLTAAAATAVVGAWAVVWRLVAAPAERKVLLVALVLVPSSTGWTLRPQVFTLLCLAIALHFVAHRRVLLLVPLMLVWANLHGGFVLGVTAILATVAASIVTGRDRARTLAAAALSIAVTFVTPLGVGVWTEIPASLERLRAYGVTEWVAPQPTNLLLLPFWSIAVALIVASAFRLRWLVREPQSDIDRLAVCLCALALLPLALRTERNVPPFLMAAVPALLALWSPRSARAARRDHPFANLLIVSVAATVVAGLIVVAWATPFARLQWTPLPAASLEALGACDAPLYNRYDEGGYLIWFARDRRVFIDSRQDPFPPDLVRAHIRAERTGDYADLFHHYAIGCAYLPTASPVAFRLKTDRWRTLYDDGRWAVLARP